MPIPYSRSRWRPWVFALLAQPLGSCVYPATQVIVVVRRLSQFFQPASGSAELWIRIPVNPNVANSAERHRVDLGGVTRTNDVVCFSMVRAQVSGRVAPVELHYYSSQAPDVGQRIEFPIDFVERTTQRRLIDVGQCRPGGGARTEWSAECVSATPALENCRCEPALSTVDTIAAPPSDATCRFVAEL